MTTRSASVSQHPQPLSDLEHLNLGYNCLQRAPTLGLSARAKLLTLNLRNNELETINGNADRHKVPYLVLLNTIRSDRVVSLNIHRADRGVSQWRNKRKEKEKEADPKFRWKLSMGVNMNLWDGLFVEALLNWGVFN